MAKRTIRKIIIAAAVILLAAPPVSFAVTAYLWSQRADYGWTPIITTPQFTTNHPRVVVDEAHGNASTIDFSGRYWPFARLLRADGYDVRKGRTAFQPETLSDVDVLVIANASGADKAQMFGINLPSLSGDDKDRSTPAFTESEIAAIHDWVEQGGSLLFIADHAPFGKSASGLAEAFGVNMFKGFVEVPGELSDPLLFTRDNGRLGDHPIFTGIHPEDEISRVMTFTGQSLQGPADATILLGLPESAIEYIPSERQGQFDSVAAGPAQGLALNVGLGRVVILGEAAMLTAQVHNGEPFGMNIPGNDNQQFALNVMHWLSREL